MTQDLAAYVELLARWNRTFNLTAIREPADMAVHHVLDALSVASWLAQLEADSRIVDVGSGAGSPGIPLAMYFPGLRFVLLDASGKKTRFLTQARIELGLGNVEVVNGRADEMRGQFEVVICRAFASLAGISEKTAHLLADGGSILAMKGRLDDDELASNLAAGLAIEAVQKIMVPFLDADRHIVVMRVAT